MANFSSTNYNPYYYGINNSYISQVGFKSQTQNYYASNLYKTQPDTVYISPENRVKQEKKLSKAQKWILGISATATLLLGSLIGHKIVNKPVKNIVKDSMSEIFRRDLTKEEASLITKQYQKIFEINNCEEFCKKMFEQMKKDYGYESVNIPLNVFYTSGRQCSEGFLKNGEWSSIKGQMSLMTDFAKNAKLPMKEKKRIFKSYIHEFQHVKQTEIAYRADKEGYINALKEYYYKYNSKDQIIERVKELLQSPRKLEEYAKSTNKSVNECRKSLEKIVRAGNDSTIVLDIPKFQEMEIRNRYENWFGNMPRIEVGTEEYKLAKKYIENERNYIPQKINNNAYFTQIREDEAYKAEKKGKKLIKYLIRN